MSHQLLVRRLVMALLLATAAVLPSRSNAISILSGPTFTPAAHAPLAGLLQLTTDADSRVSVLASDGSNTWERDFYDFSTNHSIPLLGFEPGRTNQILVTVYDEYRNACTAPDLLTFVTSPVPADFPVPNVLTSEPGMMEPGFILWTGGRVYAANGNYTTILDNSGNVVWYCRAPASGDGDVRQIDDGDLFIQQAAPSNNFLELNMLGNVVRTWYAPTNYPVDLHEGLVTSHGTILYLSHASVAISNFPSSDTNADAPVITTNVDDNPVVEISFTNSELLNAWSPLTNGLMDPTRVSYLTYSGFKTSYGVDNEHANAIIDDTNDDSIIVSLRTQNALLKFSRSTGQLKWILGPHALWGTNWQPYLLKPVGTPFDWNYGQHAPELTPRGTILVYNDNNFAASPYDPPVADQSNFSSAVEYAIDETNMTVSEVWNSAWQTNQDLLFTPYIGRVQWLPETRDVLVDYGAVSYINGVHPSPYSAGATMIRIMEYTHDPVPQVVFDVSFFDSNNTSSTYSGYDCYRAYQIPDLYTHPAEPVVDLTVSDLYGLPHLEFSADPAHTYLVQASADLKNWTNVGAAVPEGGVGDFDFDDLNAGPFSARYYRVVTQ